MLPVLLIFGGSAAERALEEEVARWRALGFPPLESWQVTAYPRGSEPATQPEPESVHIERKHYVFDVQFPNGEAEVG
jgi:hypothetical protein